MSSSILEQDFQQSDDMMAAESAESEDNLVSVEEGEPIQPMTTIMDDPSPVLLDSPTTLDSEL